MPEGPCIIITHWHTDHEVAQSRRVKKALDWVAVPTNQGKGYCRLVAKHGATGLGVWVGLLELAAKRSSERRGRIDMTVDDAALVLRVPSEQIAEVLPTLAQIGWVKLKSPVNSATPSTLRARSEDTPTVVDERVLQDRTGQDTTEHHTGDSAGDPGRVPTQEILKIWADTKKAYGTRWVKHGYKLFGGKALIAVRSCWKKLPDLTLWTAAIEAAAQDEHWSGKKPNDRYPDGWRASLENFCRPNHFEKWVEVAKERDWRYEGDEERAWTAWWENVFNGESGCPEYTGPDPYCGELTPMEQEAELAKLRGWWNENIWKGGER